MIDSVASEVNRSSTEEYEYDVFKRSVYFLGEQYPNPWLIDNWFAAWEQNFVNKIELTQTLYNSFGDVQEYGLKLAAQHDLVSWEVAITVDQVICDGSEVNLPILSFDIESIKDTFCS